MSMLSVPESQLEEILYVGMFNNIRQGLKKRLMEQIEKEIDGAVDEYLSKFKGVVSAHRDFSHDQFVFNVQIDGVKRSL